MSIEFVGMIFPRQGFQTRGVLSPDFDLEFIRHNARTHEHAGFDRVLIASGPGSADSLQIAARTFATLDHTTGGGRIRLHAITGITAEPQEGDTLLDKTERYRRTDEYLEIVRRT